LVRRFISMVGYSLITNGSSIGVVADF